MGLIISHSYRGVISDFYLKIDSFTFSKDNTDPQLCGITISYSTYGNKGARDNQEKPIYSASVKLSVSLDEIKSYQCSGSLYDYLFELLYSKVKQKVSEFSTSQDA